MKIILLADGTVGNKIAKYLIDNYIDDLYLIVTIEVNETYLEAKKKGCPVCIFESEKNLLSTIGNDLDLGILAYWPKILKNSLLRVPRNGFVNTHPSLLPYNRGKHYFFWALVEQAPFGVTLHRVDSGVDTGDIIAQKRINYDWCDTGESLYEKSQIAICELFFDTYPLLRIGKYELRPQDLQEGSFHRSSELDLASKVELDSLYRAADLLNLLRARTFESYPGCWFETDGERFEISLKIRKIN